MSDATATEATDATPGEEVVPGKSKKKLLILAGAPLLLLAIGGGLWFSGMLPGSHKVEEPATAQAQAAQPVFIDLPEVIVNMNAGGRRATFLKMRIKLEIAAADQAAVQALQPRIMDLVQTYLRELRPEELRGSMGTHRLREELLSRINIAVAPARVRDVLFVEMLVQ